MFTSIAAVLFVVDMHRETDRERERQREREREEQAGNDSSNLPPIIRHHLREKSYHHHQRGAKGYLFRYPFARFEKVLERLQDTRE